MKILKHFGVNFFIVSLVIISFSTTSNASNKLAESFTGATFPPAGWRTQYVSGLLGGGQWTRATSLFHSSPACAQSDGALLGENFLITKKVTPGAGDSLVFYVSSNYSLSALGRLDVQVSTTDSLASSFLDFLVPIQINLQLLTPNVYVRKAVSLAAYSGQPIFIAFRHIEVVGLGSVRLDGILIGGVDLNLTVLMEAHQGFTVFESPIRDRDTVTVSIRSTITPYPVIDSRKVYLDTLGKKSVNFTLGQEGVPYYIVVENRNSIRTWSDSAGEVFSSGALNYDFTTGVSNAFGNNLRMVLGKACLLQGDINNDGVVNLTDFIPVYNDNVVFTVGPYVLTDFNWDEHTNLQDIMLCWNNGVLFVTEKKPTL